MAGSANSPAWAEQYGSEHSDYASCALKLEQLIEDLLLEAEIDVVAIEGRAKSPESFLQKVEGKKDKYPDPLLDVTDLVGVRVIAYYLEDVEQIAKIIHREFDVDEEKSIDKLDELDPDRFGYRSIHYIVSLSDKRALLAEWGLFRDKCAEIQLRTATQHAWAAVEHKLSYKRTREAPSHLRRRLTRLSALFELADEQFSVIRGDLESVEVQYSRKVRGGNLDLPVDKASLEAFLTDDNVVQSFVRRAEADGMTLWEPTVDGYEFRLDIDLRDLVFVLDRSNISTIAELDALLKSDAMTTATQRLGALSREADVRWGTPADALCALILFHTDAPEALVTSIYSPGIIDFFARAREEL